MALPTPESPTHAPPVITLERFKKILSDHHSPALAEADAIWKTLIDEEVDPSFALGQFHAESLYGTAGHATVTKSWGNMLWSEPLTKNAAGQYSPGNGYTYAKYNNWTDSVKDYVFELTFYEVTWELETIYEATAKWIGEGNTPGSPDHLRYLNIVINDMISYEYLDGDFYEAGDKMVYTGGNFDRVTGKLNTKYPVTSGLQLYRGTNGDLLKTYSGASSKVGDASTYAWYLGEVQGSPDWGAICIGTTVADPKGTWVYIKNIDTNKIVTV
jgi:hypothetical protein